VTCEQRSATLGSVGGEESRTEQVELVGLAQELLGLKRFSSVGQGGACVNVAQELLWAAWVKDDF